MKLLTILFLVTSFIEAYCKDCDKIRRKKSLEKKSKNTIVKYFCKKCGYEYITSLKEDEFTTRVTCSKCHKKMYKVKDEK